MKGWKSGRPVSIKAKEARTMGWLETARTIRLDASFIGLMTVCCIASFVLTVAFRSI